MTRPNSPKGALLRHGYTLHKDPRYPHSERRTVKEMRAMRDAGASLSQIAKAFGTADSGYISLIVRRKLWKNV